MSETTRQPRKAQESSVHPLTAPDEPPLKLDEFLPYRLNVLASAVSLALSRIFGVRHGMTVPQWRVFVHLGETGSMTVTAVGHHTQMHKAKVSRAAKQLEERSLLTHHSNQADKRETFLSLTPAGRKLYRDLAPGAAAFSEMLMKVLSPADCAVFDRAITTLTVFSRQLADDVETSDADD